MLKRLYVDNFRCLSNFELTPSAQVAALVGPNGGGKSAVFHVFRALQSLLVSGEQVDRALPPWSLTRWDSRRTQRIELDVEVATQQFHYTLAVTQSEDQRGSRIQAEELRSGSDILYRMADGIVELHQDQRSTSAPTSFPFVATRSFLPLLETNAKNDEIRSFKSWLSSIFLFALNPWAMQPVSESEGDGIAIDGMNFVSWFRTLVQESPEVVAQLTEDLSPVIPGLQTISLRSVGLNTRALVLACQLGSRKFDLNVGELSEGQRALLVLYTVLRTAARRASLLMFDEPDNFITLSEIQPWLSDLRETVSLTTQGTLLVISHHPEVIDYLAADQALYLSRSDDGPTRITSVASELDRSDGVLVSEWLRHGGSSG